jgi:hypothetical protein
VQNENARLHWHGRLPDAGQSLLRLFGCSIYGVGVMTRWNCERGILDEIEHVTHLTEAAQDQIATFEALDRLRRCISKLDAVGARLERKFETRGPMPTGIGVTGA